MVYREPAPELVREAARERLGAIPAEISRVEVALGAWSRHLGDGAAAPAEALALMAERERLYEELRSLASFLDTAR